MKQRSCPLKMNDLDSDLYFSTATGQGVTTRKAAGERKNFRPRLGARFVIHQSVVLLSARSRCMSHFDLSIPRPDFQAGLRVNSWPVEDSAILQCKTREVIWAYDGIPFEFAF